MGPNRPRVSVGVPVRNGERFLAETLDSLLAQTYTDFELIISDNASTDGTEEICRAYAARDRRVQYRRSPQDVGVAGNYNRLFKQAQGEYFKWAAADDIHEPEYLERCLSVLEKDPEVVLAYGKARFIDEAGGPLTDTDPGFDLRSDAARERLRYVIYADHWVNAIFGLIRKESLGKTPLLPNYPGADYTLLGELAVAGKFFEVPELLLRRRLHPEASSQNIGDESWRMRFWTGSATVSMPLWSRTRDHWHTIRSLQPQRGRKNLVGRLAHTEYGHTQTFSRGRADGRFIK